MAQAIALTTADQTAGIRVQIVNKVNGLDSTLQTGAQSLYDTIWKNPNMTPDLMILALGTYAQTLFNFAQLAQTLLNSIVPNSVDFSNPPGWTVAFNSDGSAVGTYTTPSGS